jgi:competence protein ComEA
LGGGKLLSRKPLDSLCYKVLTDQFLMVMVTMVGFAFAAVDINTATVKELSSLKGVGVKKAEAIVEYRKGHCFQSVDDLHHVKGIGIKIMEQSKANLKVGKCKN